MTKIRVFILDDHKIVRDGIRLILENSSLFTVVGESGQSKELLESPLRDDVDILLLDITLPDISGLDVLKKVKQRRPEQKVVMLSMHDNQEYIVRSLREGANAYMPKNVESKELIRTLQAVYNDGNYIPEDYAKKVSEAEASGRSVTANLSEREKEILRLMVDGKSSKEMAKDLGISHRTIENHRLNIMRKLGTTNSSETVAKAIRLHMLM